MNHPGTPDNRPIASHLVKEDPTFADIVVEFVNDLPKRLRSLEEALQQADFDKLSSAAHQLKGSGGGYGYPILTERASKLEQQARINAFDECSALLEELKQICARVVVSD